MASPADPIIRAAALRVRAQDRPGAYAVIDAALADDPTSPPLLEFLGYVAATTGDNRRAIDAYRRLLDLDAGNMTARVNLATALMADGQAAAVEAVCASHDDPRLARLTTYLRQQRGTEPVSAAYQRIVAAHSGDFESWNNLGNALVDEDRLDEALAAFDRAVQLRPDQLPIYFNYSRALSLADRPEGRQQLMRQAARHAPDDMAVQLELGLAEAARGDLAAAETALRRAVALDPGFSPAFVELGMLLENMSRIDDLAALIVEARARDPDAPELPFLEAWLARRRGALPEALALAERTPATIHPLRRHQLIGDLYDRLGEPDRAFAAYGAMNVAAIGLQRPQPGPSYRERLTATLANLDPARVRDWSAIRVDRDPPAPIFIVGFPRSGTTLLDTLLLNVPDVHVLEELPALAQATGALGLDEAGLASLDDMQANAMRAAYFARVEALSPGAVGKIIVDKHPLHMTRVATIHRLFPDARIVLVERHPCDAVLSCFMANFQLNTAMRSFTTLAETASVYDRAFSIWERGLALFPDLRVERVRYERLVTDMEAELRPLLAALDLPWTEGVMDNRKSAANRERVRTASYSQITEPVYQRAIARWERYREHLAPVMPILAPWATRMGYRV